MNKDFLLTNQTAKELYGYVKNLPTIDYHNHLSLSDIKENKRYTDIYDLWLAPDPYKHRAMRMCGVPEKYITGDADGKKKFIKWCETVPKLLGNPLYHWAVMELEAVFGISDVPNGKNAEELYAKCNKYLAENTVDTVSLMAKFKVEFASPCASLAEDVSMFDGVDNLSPSLRGDDIVSVNGDFAKKLSSISETEINSLSDYKHAIEKRLSVFAGIGCKFSDHALDNGFKYYSDDGENDGRFKKALDGTITAEDRDRLSSYILTFLAEKYAEIGFVMQLHIGAQRYTSSKLRKKAGAVGGFAAIGNSADVSSLALFLDTVDNTEYGLPKTVLFTLNPADNALISVLSGSYSKDGVSGLITQGPAWWWCDHKKGMTDMLENAEVFSVLSNFIGMTTDSRSFLSFVRHDYFRRVLCDYIGAKYESGEYFCEIDELKNLIYKMCYENTKNAIV
ncbi:MAG: glucuronate isomerase [Clostridia bacterium]|nr:glucuronate isomerase [Clostridia bacterium]